MIKIRTAAEWRGIEQALLADVDVWQRKADAADDQPGIPQLIAEDYAGAVRGACLAAARAARTAADTARICAEEAEQTEVATAVAS